MNSTELEQNLKLYPWYQAAAGFFPWLPIFFLYFYQYVSLAEALQLSAIYYFSVFLLEVPSGYFSDRFGRRLTLILAALFAISAYFLFIVGESFAAMSIAQFLLAGFASFKTGSDNALLYDSLTLLNRENEYGQREADGARYGLISLAAAALLGGISGTVDLVIPYWLSLAAALLCLVITLKFKEPATEGSAHPFFKQLGICWSRLKDPQLLWMFLFFVLAYSLIHIPAEFNQPYVLLLDLDWISGNHSAAMISGVMVAISMLGGAFGAGISIGLRDRFGVQAVLIGGLLCIMVIIAGMASMLHPAILALVLFRNFPMAMCEAPLLAAVSPKIDSSYRATYLSLQSLAGRLGFAFFLFSLSTMLESDNGETSMQWPELQSALLVSLIVGTITVGLMIAFRPKQ